LGFYFADRLIDAGKASEEQRADLFLKFEQLAAYTRFAYSRDNSERSAILGAQRVARRFRDLDGAVPIAASVDGQILSNQKSYGLWGLYTVAR
jgi:hypothetical protein